MVAQLKIEAGWKPSIVKLGRKKGGRRTRRRKGQVQRQVQRQVPTVPDRYLTPLKLLEQVEVLRIRAQELCVEANIDSPSGYWLGDVQSVLARLVQQGTQLLRGEDALA